MLRSPNPTIAITRRPGANFKDGITESGLGVPDYEKALEQHAHYCQALTNCGLRVIRLEPAAAYPDACFVEDTAIIAAETAVVTRMGHKTRRGEESAIEDVLSEFKQIKRICQPGTVDGGDVMRLGDHYFIGISKRTNQEGAAQLADILKYCGKTSSTIVVEKFIHLKTAITSIDEETVVALSGHLPGQYSSHIKNQIIVPAEEHFAANCVSANGYVILPSNCPRTTEAVQSLGLKVLSVEVSEFQKMDGRLSCLSILL